MTDAERKRAVEVMAKGMQPDCTAAGSGAVPCGGYETCPCYEEAENALTALLRIADVKMKDHADDR